MSHSDAQADGQNRERCRLHADAEPGDDVGTVPGRRSLCNVLHGPVDPGVVLRDDHDDDGQHEPHQGRKVDVHRRDPRYPTHQLGGDEIEGDGGENGRSEHPLVESTHDVLVLAQPDEEHGDHRGDDGDRTEGEGEFRRDADVGEQQVAEKHRGNGRHSVCLEQVGCHSRAVTNVVADVVGNRRRISGIVLGDACLDLADQVRTDVGALGEDAAAEAGEDGDQASPEAESDERDDGVSG